LPGNALIKSVTIYSRREIGRPRRQWRLVIDMPNTEATAMLIVLR
jgi:hypothetical protein